MTGRLTDKQLEMMARPDNKLPPELRHEKIREVRDVCSSGQYAYQIVFDQTYLPYSYARRIEREGWKQTYARVEYHKPDGLLGFLRPSQACITIVVTKDAPTDVFGREDA